LNVTPGLGPSQTICEEQYNDDDENYPDQTIAAMAVAIARTAKATAEAAEEKDYKYDDEYQTKRHECLSLLS
jgi:hypothetical protein